MRREQAALAAFHRFCMGHPQTALNSIGQIERRLPGLHALFGNIPTPFSITPFLRPPRFFREMAGICKQLAEILEEAGHHALRDPALLEMYQFPDYFLDILQIHPGYDRLAPVLRLDGHFVNGVFRIVETNADGSAGMNDSNAIERAVLFTEAGENLRGRVHLDYLEMVEPLARMLMDYLKRFSAPARPGALGILDIPGVSTASEFVAVRKEIIALGVAAEIVTPDDLSYDGGVWAGRTKLTLIYRRLVTSDAFRWWKKLSPLIRAYRQKEVGMVGSFRSELLHNKAVLALLHCGRIRERLSPAARRMVDRHVPRAMILTAETAEAAVASRDRWVIKPLDGYGSRGVAVGCNLSASRWSRALKEAVAQGRYILQDYVPANTEPVLRLSAGRLRLSPELTSAGFFLYNGRFAGPYIRSGPAHPLSLSCGALTRPGYACRPISK